LIGGWEASSPLIGEKESSPLLGRSVGGYLEASLEEMPGMEENGGKFALSHVASISCTETDKTFMDHRDYRNIYFPTFKSHQSNLLMKIGKKLWRYNLKLIS
jgi:hypothetical protein